MARSRKSSTDATAAFFEALAARGREPLLDKATGTTRFEIVDGRKIDRWLVTIDKGAISASRRNAAADCVVRVDRALFEQLVTGRKNAVAAVLRGEFAIEGDWRLLVRMQRLFPGRRRRKRAA